MQPTFLFLDDFLTSTQVYWRLEPFHLSITDEVPWSVVSPALYRWLMALEDSDVTELKADPQSIGRELSRHIPGYAGAMEKMTLPSVVRPNEDPDPVIENGIPGRKLAQIRRMSQAACTGYQAGEWLEWCAGKGYLGRMLASHTRIPVVSLEYQQALCESGQQAAHKLRLPMTFVRGDALGPSAVRLFRHDQHAVALHACGDLHVRFLQYASRQKTAAVTFAPCCYHLTSHEEYQPISEAAGHSALKLTRAELRIPLQETVTGGERVTRHRYQEMSYRLGLDALLRAETGAVTYCSVPSVRKSQLAEGFEAFCRWAAGQKSLNLPAGIDFEHYRQIGDKRFWQMERLSLVQLGFRRMLEIWLVMDKALFLQEQGYNVVLSEFCERSVTPRNILVQARYSGSVL